MIGAERLAAMRDVALTGLEARCGRPDWHPPDCRCQPPNPLARAVLDLLDEVAALSATSIHNYTLKCCGQRMGWCVCEPS